MKGIVFTEFIEMVEETFSMEMADEIIENAHLESGGAYTTLGTYDHREMLELVTQLSQSTGIPVPDLVRVFGIHLCGRFADNLPGHVCRRRRHIRVFGADRKSHSCRSAQALS